MVQKEQDPKPWDPQEPDYQHDQQLDNPQELDTIDMCPHITNACIAATAPVEIRDLIHTAI